MLNDATCFREVYIVCGYTDLRSGMDRLAAVIEAKTGTSPYVPGALYLFCGRQPDSQICQCGASLPAETGVCVVWTEHFPAEHGKLDHPVCGPVSRNPLGLPA